MAETGTGKKKPVDQKHANSLLYQSSKRAGAGITAKRGLKLANINLDGEAIGNKSSTTKNVSEKTFDLRTQQKKVHTRPQHMKKGSAGQQLSISKQQSTSTARQNPLETSVSFSILSQPSNSWRKTIKHEETKSVTWLDWFCGTCNGGDVRRLDRQMAIDEGRAPVRLESFPKGKKLNMESDASPHVQCSVHSNSMVFGKHSRGISQPRYTNEELDRAIFNDDFQPPSEISQKPPRKISWEEDEVIKVVTNAKCPPLAVEKAQKVHSPLEQQVADMDLSGTMMMDVDEATPRNSSATALMYTDRHAQVTPEQARQQQQMLNSEIKNAEEKQEEHPEEEQQNNFEMRNDSSISSDTSIPEEQDGDDISSHHQLHKSAKNFQQNDVVDTIETRAQTQEFQSKTMKQHSQQFNTSQQVSGQKGIEQSSQITSSHASQEVVISSIDFKGANKQRLHAKNDDELAEFERLEAEILKGDKSNSGKVSRGKKRMTITNEQYRCSEKTTPVDPAGGPRATARLKRHSVNDGEEKDPNELLEEQVARNLSPDNDEHDELRFELDSFKSLNKSMAELVFSDCGNKNKKEEISDLANFEDFQSRNSITKKNKSDEKKQSHQGVDHSDSLDDGCVNIQSSKLLPQQQQQSTAPKQMFPPPAARRIQVQQKSSSHASETKKQTPRKSTANQKSGTTTRTKQQQPSNLTSKRTSTQQAQPQKTTSTNEKRQATISVSGTSPGVKTESSQYIEAGSASWKKNSSPTKAFAGNRSPKKVQAKKTEQTSLLSIPQHEPSDTPASGLTLKKHSKSTIKIRTLSSSSQPLVQEKQRSVSNLARTQKTEPKKTINDVFAKYASVAQINLGPTAPMIVNDTSKDDASMNDAMRELARSIRSDSQKRLASNLRERSKSRKSLVQDPSSFLSETHGNSMLHKDFSQANISGFNQQKKQQQQQSQHLSLVPTHAVIQERPPTNCTDIYSETNSRSKISSVQHRRNSHNMTAPHKRAPIIVSLNGKATSTGKRAVSSKRNDVDDVLNRYSSKERIVDDDGAQNKAIKELRRSFNSKGSFQRSTVSRKKSLGLQKKQQSQYQNESDLEDALPVGLNFGLLDKSGAGSMQEKLPGEATNRNSDQLAMLQRDRSMTHKNLLKAPLPKIYTSHQQMRVNSFKEKNNPGYIYKQNGRSPKQNSSEATSLMTAQFGRKQSNSPSMRLKMMQSATVHHEPIPMEPIMNNDNEQLHYSDALEDKERQKSKTILQRKQSKLWHQQQFSQLHKNHSVNPNVLPTLDEIQNFKKIVKKPQAQPEEKVQRLQAHRGSLKRSSAVGSPQTAMQKNRTKPTSYFAAQGGTDRRSVPKNVAIEQTGGGPLFSKVLKSNRFGGDNSKNIRRSVSPRNRTPGPGIRNTANFFVLNSRSSSVMHERRQDLTSNVHGDKTRPRRLSNVLSQRNLSATKDFRIHAPPKVVVSRLKETPVQQAEQKQMTTTRASTRQRSPPHTNRPSTARLGSTIRATTTRLGQTQQLTQSMTRLKPVTASRTLNMNGTMPTSKQTERRVLKKSGSSIPAVLGKPQNNNARTDETATARVNMGLRGNPARPKAQAAQSGTQATQRSTVARASITIAGTRVQKGNVSTAAATGQQSSSEALKSNQKQPNRNLRSARGLKFH